MKISVFRKWATSLSVIGEMTIDSQPKVIYSTLEPPYGSPDVKPRAIPAGTYKVSYRFSPKHNMNVPHVENVPGFEDIEIHPGNFPKDTLGCCLVGLSRGPSPDFISASRPAFLVVQKLVRDAVDKGEQVWISYYDHILSSWPIPAVIPQKS